MTRCFAGLVACLFIVSATTADAQFFRFGPWGGVSIRAPFVNVDVGPGGATSVRAPFTAVDTPGYPSYPYSPFGPSVSVGPGAGAVYPAPAYPATPSLSVPSYARPGSSAAARPITADPATVAQQLRSSAIRLQSSLMRRRDDSDVWLKYLAPDRIIESIERGESPASLSDLVRAYDGVVSNPSLSPIQRVDGFVATRQALRQWVQLGSQQVDASQVQQTPKQQDTGQRDTGESLELPAPVPVPEPNPAEPDATTPQPPAARPPGAAANEPEVRTGAKPTRRSI